MARTVAIGIQNFEKIRENNYFYIDKTLFIKEWWESGDEVTLITRPRRFGKTLNLSMLEQFFSIDYAKKQTLFEGLAIWQEEKYQQLQGTYPVISLSFANVKEKEYRVASYRIRQLLMKQYEKNNFLKGSSVLSEAEKQYLDRVTNGLSEEDAPIALYQLSDFLCRYYGKKVIILLDEYDTPMQEAYMNGYCEELVSFVRSLFNCTFKTNPYLERGIMTGITRVSKESIFSDLNHLKVVTTTSDKYTTSFGFTEEEVFVALEEQGLETEKTEVKRWYDGFIFGTQRDIYNPWSILNFLDSKKYETYWANTSSNRLVSKLIREGNRKIKVAFEQLLRGESIQCPIEEQIIYSQMKDKEIAVWSLLVASGYLKVLSYEKIVLLSSGKRPKYELTFTNFEVKSMFLSIVQDWFDEVEVDYSDFIKALLYGNKKEMNIFMNRITIQMFSYFDTGKGPFGKEPERFYHGFVLGLLVELNDTYVITSNRESGYGRYDIMLEPKCTNPLQYDAMILEFKVHDAEEEQSLQDTVASALAQIEEKQYETVLIAKGIPKERIRKYGFAFEGKKVLIG